MTTRVPKTDEGLAAAGLAVPLLRHVLDRAGPDNATAASDIRRLVSATFEIIATSGDLEPQVRDILAESGLSRQSFYRYFRSKDELMLVVLDSSWRGVASQLAKRVAKADGPEAKVKAWIDGVMRQAQDADARRRTRPFVVMSGRLHVQFPGELDEAARVMSGSLEEAIIDGVAAGVFSGADPAGDARFLYFAVFGLQNHHLVVGTVPSRAEIGRLHRSALRYLAAG